MSIVLDTLKAKGNDSILAIAKKNFQDMRDHFTQYVEHFADTTHYEPNAIFAARMLNPVSEGAFIEEIAQTINRKFPGTKMSKEFAEYYVKISPKQRLHTNTASLDNGSRAPELALPDADGKIITLASLRGKYVLVDFWASWCGPCRGENPNVVQAYQEFKDKNFTILGVSLDNNKDAWQKAIKEDHLTWPQVCDLKGWASAGAVIYSIQSIPSNYLIDPNGKIVTSNLRGEALEKVLANLLK
jgi:peroxiredoxin